MEKIVYLSENENYHLDTTAIQKEYNIFKSNDLKQSILYIIDHPEVYAFIYDIDNESDEKNTKVMETIYNLNQLMPFIGVASGDSVFDESIYKVINPNLQIISPHDKISEVIEETQKNRRRFNRTEWPLSAVFYQESNPADSENGVVLSLSAGGAYIKTTGFNVIGEDNILIEIKFKDFKFLVEGKVLRMNKDVGKETPMGMAIEFVKVSDATRRYITHLINNHILSNLLMEIEPYIDENEGP